MTAKQDKTDDIAALTFEQAFSRLAAAVERLQGGNLSLEQALAEFEAGQTLAERCNQLLDEAELKVSQVSVTATIISESAASYTLDLFSLRTSSDDAEGADDESEDEDKDDRFKDIPF
jgi:exodeoxyribonuclease VII small subunit